LVQWMAHSVLLYGMSEAQQAALAV
jgi:hypothetical protein